MEDMIGYIIQNYEQFLILALLISMVIAIVLLIKSPSPRERREHNVYHRDDYVQEVEEPARIIFHRPSVPPPPAPSPPLPNNREQQSGNNRRRRIKVVYNTDLNSIDPQKILSDIPSYMTVECGHCRYDLSQGFIFRIQYFYDGVKKSVQCPRCGNVLSPAKVKSDLDFVDHRREYLTQRVKAVEDFRNYLNAHQDENEREDKDYEQYFHCKKCPHFRRDEEGNYYCPVKLNDVNPDDKICKEYIISLILGRDVREIKVA